MKGKDSMVWLIMMTLLGITVLSAYSMEPDLGIEGLPTIKKGARQGFANAGWKYDRYKDLASLDARTRMLVADLQGPGIIRHFHTTRHNPADLFARGIVLEIWFDDADTPAVLSPLADFFGDGCNGASMPFSTPLIECAPWSYNCYFPMPFRKRARVYLRNDTARDAVNYSYVEWEPLSRWDPSLGYFHASYARRRIQLTTKTSETFLDIRGSGHIIGRQFSVITDEPGFRDFNDVMEGNNEVDIDGRERAFDYLGSEDSFTFSWGFREPFAGLRAGMPHVKLGTRNELSIYRFHDHMPIRFDKSLIWRINWQHEAGMLTRADDLQRRSDEGGGWVDYATVHYWYQDAPGGYAHTELPAPEWRGNVQPITDRELAGMIGAMRPTPEARIDFSTADSLNSVHVVHAWSRTHPFWIDVPETTGGHPGNPNPGRQGVLAMHPAGPTLPGYVLARLSRGTPSAERIRIRVSGDPYEAPGKSDFVLAIGVASNGGITWLTEAVVDAGSPPGSDNWRTIESALPSNLDGPIGIVLRIAYGGTVANLNEEAFIDEIAIVAD